MALVLPSLSASYPNKVSGKWKKWRYVDLSLNLSSTERRFTRMCAFACTKSKKKRVWIWTENKQVMTAAVERGWNTFIFPSNRQHLPLEWSSIALIEPLFIQEGGIFDHEHQRVAAFAEISSPQQLEQFQISEEQADKVVVDLLDWQVIPAENIVAAFQGTRKTVLAVSKTQSEAQVFLEALEHGLGGVVMKVEDVGAILELKGYFDRRHEVDSLLNLTKAKITHVQATGMGDRVCVDICSLMRPGEGLLGPVHAYVAVPGGKTSYLSELKSGKEVIVVDQKGMQRTAIVGRVKVETRPLILVEAKVESENESYSILLQNAETVGLVSPLHGEGHQRTTIPVTSLKVGDEVLLLKQGGARHTGIEIKEFIVEK
ncbi:uncharacterized protein LOC132036405 isoform X4 [Lycium ferocissimum]|uniref:uncharacterized protein LOC132036405 isoform X4 n=1 Tax=Lycium ferocissimum TaxID=112874 RepID=UPI002815D676|nr:uncharacterized protein LOC132036405 isoform X4 [Lycium ferocissimum]